MFANPLRRDVYLRTSLFSCIVKNVMFATPMRRGVYARTSLFGCTVKYVRCSQRRWAWCVVTNESLWLNSDKCVMFSSHWGVMFICERASSAVQRKMWCLQRHWGVKFICKQTYLAKQWKMMFATPLRHEVYLRTSLSGWTMENDVRNATEAWCLFANQPIWLNSGRWCSQRHWGVMFICERAFLAEQWKMMFATPLRREVYLRTSLFGWIVKMCDVRNAIEEWGIFAIEPLELNSEKRMLETSRFWPSI